MIMADETGQPGIVVTPEVAISSGKRIRVGNDDFKIVSDSPPTVFSDYLVEYRHIDGLIYFTLGHSVVDAGNPPEMHIVSRHRMSVVSAQILQQTLADLVGMAMKPADKSQAN
jgi:hypothetical protein